YADDTKLFDNPIANYRQLQADLSSLEKWSTDWCLPLNGDKCVVLHLGHNNPKRQYLFHGTVLKTAAHHDDLGVTISSNLSWSEHIAKIVKKANSTSYLLYKAFEKPDPILQRCLIKTYIRPILEYGALIWSPHLVKDIKAIEKV